MAALPCRSNAPVRVGAPQRGASENDCEATVDLAELVQREKAGVPLAALVPGNIGGDAGQLGDHLLSKTQFLPRVHERAREPKSRSEVMQALDRSGSRRRSRGSSPRSRVRPAARRGARVVDRDLGEPNRLTHFGREARPRDVDLLRMQQRNHVSRRAGERCVYRKVDPRTQSERPRDRAC